MPSIEGLSCAILVGKEVLTEYHDTSTGYCPYTAPASIYPSPPPCCYVQSRDNTEFALIFHITDVFRQRHPDVKHLRAIVRIDGQHHALSMVIVSHARVRIKGVPVRGDWSQLHPFRFAKRAITDDASIAAKTTTGNARELGEIRVDLLRFEVLERVSEAETAREYPPLPQCPPPREVRGPVHEKALKGRDVRHAVELGASERARDKMQVLRGRELDTVDRPFMSFVFRYRSKHALQVLGMVRRSPSPEPPSEIEQLAGLSKEDLMKEVLALRAQTSKIKRETSADPPRARTDSRETRVKRRKREIVTVDLTEE